MARTIYLETLKLVRFGVRDSTFKDQLTSAEQREIQTPPEFWDHANRRPRHSSPARGGFAAAATLSTRDQDGRKNCVCFALVAAIELRALRQGLALDLSEQFASYLLIHAQGRSCTDLECEEKIRLYDALKILAGRQICDEHDCTYQDHYTEPSDAARARAKYAIDDYFLIPRISPPGEIPPMTPCLDGPGISNTAYLECIIAQGFDIVVVLCLSGTKLVLPDSGIILIDCDFTASPYFCLPFTPDFSHAIVIFAYVRIGDIPYFVCRDSLRGLSDCKPLLISYDYMRTYAQYGAVVTAISID